MKHVPLSVIKRNPILFAQTAADFNMEVGKLCEEVQRLGTAEYLQAAADVAIDLRSAITQWRLQKLVQSGTLQEGDLIQASNRLLGLVKDHGAQELHDASIAEIDSISQSEIRRMTELTREGVLNTYWGHDYASGLAHSMRRGACWMTSNPSKITALKKDQPELIDALMADILAEHGSASAEDMTSLLFMKVCAINAYALMPIFEATNGQWGVVFIQANPFLIPLENGAQMMVEQVEFWDKAFKAEMNVAKPNVMYKLPAVETGLGAVEDLIAKGYRLCLTLNFTVSQHEIFARLLSKGKELSYVVLMGGLLDDKVTEELKTLGVDNAKEIGLHAAQAVIRKSYKNLRDKKLDDRVSIMTAAVRGPWAIANTLAEGGSPPTLITTLTNKINEFDSNPMPLVSQLSEPMDPRIMEVLNKSQVFRQAYSLPEEGLLNWDNLFDFPPFIAFYDQFRASYKEIADYVQEKRG